MSPLTHAKARSYLLTVAPAAISGEEGHSTAFSVACRLVHGFRLEPSYALRLMKEVYNPRCEPPWTEEELRHKINGAAQAKEHRNPAGYMVTSKFTPLLDLRQRYGPPPFQDKEAVEADSGNTGTNHSRVPAEERREE